MKSRWILVVCLVCLVSALGAAALRQDYPTGGQTATQEKPYTLEDPGPWPAAVAKTHSPMITYEKSDMGLKVTVKIDNHPMDPNKPHYIMWIRLEDGMGNKLGEKKFVATDLAPIATFDLSTVPDTLKAFEQCNIHGIWMSQTKVEMK